MEWAATGCQWGLPQVRIKPGSSPRGLSCLFPLSPEGARLSGLASSPAPALSLATPCCCTVLLSAGKQDNSEETRAIAQGEAFGGRLPGSAGRSTQAAPGAVLIPAAQALPSLPIHCRCAGKQGARDPGSPHPQPAHAPRGTAPSPPCPRAAGSTGACLRCGLLPHIIQRCHEPPSPQVFGAIMQSRSISTPATSSPQSPPRRPSVSPGRAWGRHPRLQGALGAPGTLQLTGDSLLAPACPLRLPRAFLCQKHSVSICSAAINQRDAHTSTGRRWAPRDQGAARCLR